MAQTGEIAPSGPVHQRGELCRGPGESRGAGGSAETALPAAHGRPPLAPSHAATHHGGGRAPTGEGARWDTHIVRLCDVI